MYHGGKGARLGTYGQIGTVKFAYLLLALFDHLERRKTKIKMSNLVEVCLHAQASLLSAARLV